MLRRHRRQATSTTPEVAMEGGAETTLASLTGPPDSPPRRPWIWVLGALGLLVAGAVVRDLLLGLDEAELVQSVTPGWAYIVCALLVFADGVCALFPAETTLIAASTLVVEGVLELRLVMLAGAVGAVTGDSALYWLARLSRDRFQSRLETALRNDKVAETMDLIGSNTPVLLVTGRYVPGLRFVVNASCGLARFPYRRFLLWSAVGGVSWSVITCLTAYLVGTALGDKPIAALLAASLVSTLAVAFVFLLIRRHRAKRRAQRVALRSQPSREG